jgi:hypothetical protein
LSGGFCFELLFKLDGTDIAQRTVGSQVVVFPPPVFDHDTSFGQRVEPLSVETLVAQPSVEALDKAVLPRATRIDVERLDRLRREPCSQLLLDKWGLRFVVTAFLGTEPLSLRICSGAPCSAISRLMIERTLRALILRSTWMHRLCRVYSSRTVSMRSLPPRIVVSCTYRARSAT